MEKEYENINQDLQKIEVINDIKKMTELMRRSRSLEKTVNVYRELKQTEKNIKDLNELVNSDDDEIVALAREEIEESQNKIKELKQQLKVLLLPKDPNDEKNVIIEIRGAAGGDEANIFAGDLFRMYSRYAADKGWKIQVLDAVESEMGGFSQIEFVIEGESVYSLMKFESGAHRVQRVPETESGGRIHTSTATVDRKSVV